MWVLLHWLRAVMLSGGLEGGYVGAPTYIFELNHGINTKRQFLGCATIEFSVICGPDPKLCIYTDVCNQEVFQISFLQFV